MAYKITKRVSVPTLKSLGPTKTELRAKEVGERSVMLYGKMGWRRSQMIYKAIHIICCCKLINKQYNDTV